MYQADVAVLLADIAQLLTDVALLLADVALLLAYVAQLLAHVAQLHGGWRHAILFSDQPVLQPVVARVPAVSEAAGTTLAAVAGHLRPISDQPIALLPCLVARRAARCDELCRGALRRAGAVHRG